MKNAFKLGVLALAVSVSFAACSGKKSTSAADSAAKADSMAKMSADTTKKDTTKADTSKKMAADTTKKKM
jgi:hypothetical protein